MCVCVCVCVCVCRPAYICAFVIRFAGLLIYFGYGIWHSSENRPDDVDSPDRDAERQTHFTSYSTNSKEASLTKPNSNYEDSDERSTLLVK